MGPSLVPVASAGSGVSGASVLAGSALAAPPSGFDAAEGFALTSITRGTPQLTVALPDGIARQQGNAVSGHHIVEKEMTDRKGNMVTNPALEQVWSDSPSVSVPKPW